MAIKKDGAKQKTKPVILVVDDQPQNFELLEAYLVPQGYEIVKAANGEEALGKLSGNQIDLILLDVTMPGMDGFEVCRWLREWAQIPVIMLSARGNESDKVKCLDLGADDYITKPFGVKELLARVRALLRRSDAPGAVPAQPQFVSGNLVINFAGRRVTVNNQEVALTRTEYNLLQELALNASKVLTYKMLLNKVWGAEYAEEKQYLHVFIGRLRKHVERDPQNPEYIITVPGVGYQFRHTA